MNVDLSAHPAPISGLVGLLHLCLLMGGFIIWVAICGFHLFHKHMKSKKEILKLSFITLIVLCIIYFFLCGADLESMLFCTMQQTIGFFVGGLIGHWYAKKKKRHV